MSLRHPSARDWQPTPRGSGDALAVLIRALAPGDEEALRGAARAMALWPGVYSVTIEVAPDQIGQASIFASDGGGHSPQREPPHLRIDLVDRERIIGALSVWFDDSDATPPEVLVWCDTAAALLSSVAARCRLEAMLLDAQRYEVMGQIDLAPTIAGLLGLSVDGTAFVGRDVLADGTGEVGFPDGSALDDRHLFRSSGMQERSCFSRGGGVVAASECDGLRTRAAAAVSLSRTMLEGDAVGRVADRLSIAGEGG